MYFKTDVSNCNLFMQDIKIILNDWLVNHVVLKIKLLRKKVNLILD